MAFEKRELTGAMFPNDKRGNAKAPDWRGYVIINGVEYELGGWAKTSARGEFISMSAKVKEERRDEHPQQSISQRATPKGPAKRSIIPDDDMGGDAIPF